MPEQSPWETQRPLEYANLSLEHDRLRTKYNEILSLHAKLVNALVEHRAKNIEDYLSTSLHDANLYSRADLDEKLKQFIKVPHFLK